MALVDELLIRTLSADRVRIAKCPSIVRAV
jgi:hypothetical protein